MRLRPLILFLLVPGGVFGNRPGAKVYGGHGPLGLGLFFVMMMLSGAGPPFEVMTGVMRHVSDILPLTYVTRILQAPWLGTGLAWREVAVTCAITLAAAITARVAFCWE